MRSNLHVVHVYKDVFPPVAGGIEKHIDLIRRSLPDLQTDVLVCARGPRGLRRQSATGVEVHVPELGPRPWSVPLAPTFAASLRRIEADIVHVHMPNPLGEVAALTDIRRPLVCSYHADIVRQARVAPLYRRLVRACLARATEVIVGSHRLAATSPFLGAHARRATVIPYFIDAERFASFRASDADRAKLKKRYGDPIVLTVARLVHYKGLDVLIEAARSLDASVVVVGDGPLAGRLGELASAVSTVHMTGAVSEHELLCHLAVADCFVLPSTSRAESFGISVLEAQAMGVPAIVTDVGTGTVEAIDPGSTGLVVPPRDAGALAAAITQLLEDRGLRQAMGQRARDRALTQHSPTGASDQLRAIYARAVAPAAREVST
jgi:O-antigen biosynthesis rhamnosyltransferase